MFQISLKIGLLAFIPFSLQNCDLGSTCDCFDEPEYSFVFQFDIKSYNLGIPVKEFISASDSLGSSKYYNIKIYTSDSTFQQAYFNTNGKDSILYFDVWW